MSCQYVKTSWSIKERLSTSIEKKTRERLKAHLIANHNLLEARHHFKNKTKQTQNKWLENINTVRFENNKKVKNIATEKPWTLNIWLCTGSHKSSIPNSFYKYINNLTFNRIHPDLDNWKINMSSRQKQKAINKKNTETR